MKRFGITRRRYGVLAGLAVTGAVMLGSALPASALVAATGSGVLQASISYGSAPIPGGILACAATNWTLSTNADQSVDGQTVPDGGAIDLKGDAYVGGFNFSGTGHSACEQGSDGTGTVAVTIGTMNPLVTGSTIACSLLTGASSSGPYIRTGVIFTSLVTDNCLINNVPDGTTQIPMVGLWLPTGPGQPSTAAPIDSASWDAAWAIGAVGGSPT